MKNTLWILFFVIIGFAWPYAWLIALLIKSDCHACRARENQPYPDKVAGFKNKSGGVILYHPAVKGKQK